MKLGKKPATKDRRDLRFKAYLAHRQLPTPPKDFGHEKLVTEWGMLGNDDAGDCVWAGAAHEHMLWCAAADSRAEFRTSDVLASYSAVTGYNAGNPDTDEGTDVREAMRYRQQIGILDTEGKRHRIGAYVKLDAGNLAHLYQALYLFDAVGIGIEFPESAEEQFDASKPWTVKRGAKINGGHYIPLVAKRNGQLFCVTWGKLQAITLPFYRKYCDEAWGFVSEDSLNKGRSCGGFDLPQLKADLEALKA